MSDYQGSCNEVSGISCVTACSPFKKVGNVLSCNVEIVSELLGRGNQYLNPDSCPRSSITGVNLTITMGCASVRNLIQGLFGSAVDVESGSKVDEFCIEELEQSDFFPFSKKQATLNTVVVRLLDEDNDEVMVLVEGVDYKLSKSGVQILKDIDILNASEIEIAYDYNTINFTKIKFGTLKQGYKSLYFKGTNYADGGAGLFDAEFTKVYFKPMDLFNLITADEFLTITLQGVVDKVNGEFFSITKQEE